MNVYLSRSLADIESQNPGCRVLSSAATESFRPPSHLLSGRNYYWRAVCRNLNGTMPGPIWQFTTDSGPLAGNYRIGGANGDFATFAEAVSELAAFGISAPTSVRAAPGSYYETLTIPLIAGTSDDHPLYFGRIASDSSVTIIGNGTAPSVLKLNGSAFVTFDGVDFRISGGSPRMGVELAAGSENNCIRNSLIIGPGAEVSNGRGVYLVGPNSNGNRFDSLTVRRFVRGFHLDSQSSGSSTGNIIEHCQTDTVRSGVFVARQNKCHIRRSRLAVDAGSFDETDGIIVATTLPEDSVFIYDNQISRVVTAGSYAVGIRIKPDSAAAVVRIYNNTICNFGNTGSSQVRAIYITAGRCLIESNSIQINDVAATGASYALYIGTVGSAGYTTIRNNIFANRESSSIAYGIFVLSGSAAFYSDYNIFYGTGSNYRMGRWLTDQVTLALWKAATGGDEHSFAGDPGFVSSTDLHIMPSYGLANQNGAILTGQSQDIDDDPRLIPPDRGADEYEYIAPPADFAVMDLVGIQPSYLEFVPVSIRVAVQNRGSEIQRGVAVRLWCNDSLQDERRVTLTP
ncbi:hypothetical protein EHM69_13095, partial [candidate division KSB1 bacterium]